MFKNFNMKKIILFLIIFCFFSCFDNKEEKYLNDFNQVLGKENIETIDLLVNNFEENYLKVHYPKLILEKAYKQFLIDLSKNELKSNFSYNGYEKFYSSQLKNEIYKYPDSVWIVFDSLQDEKYDEIKIPLIHYPYIKKRYKYIEKNGSINYGTSGVFENLNGITNFDSIINSHLNSGRFNGIGKYIQALDTIKNKSDFHKKFFEVKQSAGIIDSQSSASVMIINKIDLNDKLNRKLIVMEMLY
jgi:hypothetical protein